MSTKVRGLVPVVPTPLLADEALDEESFAQLAEFTLRYPFAAIWALASAGEDQNLPDDVIDEATRLFVKYFSGKLPVWVKTSHAGTRETIERTRRMSGLGINAAIVLFEHKRLSTDHVRRHFLDIAEQSPVPIVIYDNGNRGGEVDVSLYLELSAHPNIIAMKAGGSDLARLTRLCLFADPDFSVLTAGGGQILTGLAMGAAGHTAIPLLAFPERAFAVAEAVQGGDLERARAEQRVINDFITRMPKLQNREVHGEVKCVLEIRGVINRHVSAPFMAATEPQKAEFEKLIEQVDLFCKDKRWRAQ